MKQKKGFLSILLGTSGASLLRNLLAGKRAKHSNIPERRVMGAVKGTITQMKARSLIMYHLLPNFEM